LNPNTILSSSFSSVLARYTSFLVIGPMPALTTGILASFSKTRSASRLPRESAFATIPVSSHIISSDISLANSS